MWERGLSEIILPNERSSRRQPGQVVSVHPQLEKGTEIQGEELARSLCSQRGGGRGGSESMEQQVCT